MPYVVLGTGALVLAAVAACQQQPSSSQAASASAAAGETTPAKLLATTVLPNLKDNERALGDYTGAGGLLLVFVDIDSPDSNQAIDEMSNVTGTLGGHGIETVLVNLDEEGKLLKAFYGGCNTGAHVVYDTGDATQKAWKVESVPTLALFDATGELQYRGGAVWDDVAAAAAKMLSLPAGSISFAHGCTEYG